MTGIAWRMLRRQLGMLVGALIMTTIGAALLTAFVVIQESVSRTRAPVERFAAAEVVAAGNPACSRPTPSGRWRASPASPGPFPN